MVIAIDSSGNRSTASTAASATPSVAAGAALQFNGPSDYVTFGAGSAPHATSFTLETWFRRTGRGRRDDRHRRHHRAIPLVTKAGAEGEAPANLNSNCFLGIDAATGVLVADFEETAGGPTIRSRA